ncbi:hypothetical protein DPEC_G00344850 [Dallia pectoralis]|uniref:Uncharacterized protein n=1 Tax=Dallia pectoralis TaxID=75939 RepID=A0ACC2F3R3_DALPE|nr:hypothetical protein DPEC_G00344850 [Dallia pectoralis]
MPENAFAHQLHIEPQKTPPGKQSRKGQGRPLLVDCEMTAPVIVCWREGLRKPTYAERTHSSRTRLVLIHVSCFTERINDWVDGTMARHNAERVCANEPGETRVLVGVSKHLTFINPF